MCVSTITVVFLQGVERCIEKRIRIFGLDAPKTININWRKQAEDLGIDPDKILYDIEAQFIKAAQQGRIDRDQKDPPSLPPVVEN